MALLKDGLWGIANGTENAPDGTDEDKLAKFVSRRDKALAIIVLAVEPKHTTYSVYPGQQKRES